MKNPEAEQHERDSDRYLQNIGDRYVFDGPSGIYKQQPTEATEEARRQPDPNQHGNPLWVNVRRDWLMIALSALTLILLGFTVHYAKKQWMAMNDTYKQMSQQTTLLQEQVEASMSATLSKQFKISWPDKNQGYLSVVLINRGRTDAKNVRGNIKISEVSIPNKRVIVKNFPSWKFLVPSVSYSQDFPSEEGISLPITSETMKGTYGMPRAALKLTGTVIYFNGFRDRTDDLCYYVLGAFEFRDKSGAVGQFGAENVITCGALPSQVSWFRTTQANAGAH